MRAQGAAQPVQLGQGSKGKAHPPLRESSRHPISTWPTCRYRHRPAGCDVDRRSVATMRWCCAGKQDGWSGLPTQSPTHVRSPHIACGH